MRFVELADQVRKSAVEHGVPGAQLAIYREGECSSVEFGEAVYGAGPTVTTESKFPLGSVTKAFTAALAMIFVAEDEVELDAPVGDRLPASMTRKLPELSDSITLRMLLSHTSGLMSDWEWAGESEPTRLRYLTECCERDLDYPSGSAFSYSNVGYLLIGYLIETITGMDWHEAVESILLRPLRIEARFFVGTGEETDNAVVTGHVAHPSREAALPIRQTLSEFEAPVGALALSATDLVHFGRMFLADGGPAKRPLDFAFSQQMYTPTQAAEPFGLADGWGAGLALYGTGPRSWCGHDGTADGAACHLRIDPAHGVVVALTSNANTGLRMWDDVVSALHGAGLAVQTYPYAELREAGTPVDAPANCAGSYFNGESEYRVRTEDGQCLLMLDGKPHSKMTFYGPDVFTMQSLITHRADQVGRFLFDPVKGEFDRLQVAGRLAVKS